LGLEIRPGVAAYAKDRVKVHQLQGQLDFLGCNANVDLDRVLTLYQSHYTTKASTMPTTSSCQDLLCLHRVTIQFPDPHFKTQHMKRRVVTKTLVDTIAKFMPTNGTIILQSDIQSVLDDMRRRFRESAPIVDDEDFQGNDETNLDLTQKYFMDSMVDDSKYIADNCLGVPTEREQSVLAQGLPVYRALLKRSVVLCRKSTSTED
jgi:tRNA (guanine-N7-)-methyltransferase